MMTPRANWITRIAAPMRGLGPYAAIELILPGGSLIALSLWAIRHRAWFASRMRAVLSRFPGLMPVAERERAVLVAERSNNALDLIRPGAGCTPRN